MSKALDKLREIITTSQVSPADQNDLLIFLPVLPEQAVDDLCRIFTKNPKIIKEFNEDFKARLDILVNGRDKWDKLIAHEEEMLEKEEEDIL